MNGWLPALKDLLLQGRPVVRIVVASIRGSAPREAGASMLVADDAIHGSIGGGHLELRAIAIARDMLAQPMSPASRLDRFALGAALGQCCGGAVRLWFDRVCCSELPFVNAALTAGRTTIVGTLLAGRGSFRRFVLAAHESVPRELDAPQGDVQAAIDQLRRAPPDAGRALLVPATVDRAALLLERVTMRRPQLWLYGAGHVGRAVVGVTADLPFDIRWVDPRADAFPHDLPAHATRRCVASPVDEALVAPAGAWHLVMTHSHELDYALCCAILRRDEHAWAGLIGSETKAACFNVRFARDGIPAQAVRRLVCPIGWRGIRSKQPGAIAISVAAQLLQTLEAMNDRRAEEATRYGVGAETTPT